MQRANRGLIAIYYSVLAVGLTLAGKSAVLGNGGIPIAGPSAVGSAIPAPDYPWSQTQLLEPAELVRILGDAKAEKPLLLHVGFQVLYLQAHIPGSEFLGPAAKEDGLSRLKARAQQVAKTREIVLYCGCCPWDHCPNLRPAFETLRSMGFRRVKVLYIPKDFGHDWVDKGFPVARD